MGFVRPISDGLMNIRAANTSFSNPISTDRDSISDAFSQFSTLRITPSQGKYLVGSLGTHTVKSFIPPCHENPMHMCAWGSHERAKNNCNQGSQTRVEDLKRIYRSCMCQLKNKFILIKRQTLISSLCIFQLSALQLRSEFDTEEPLVVTHIVTHLKAYIK